MNERLIPEAGGRFFVCYALAPRFAIAAAALLVFKAKSIFTLTRAELRQGAAVGVFTVGGMLFQNDGMRFTSASTCAFLTSFYAVLIPAWIALRGRRNPGAAIWIGCAFVLAGTAVLGRFDWRTLRLGRGEWETLLCSVSFAAQILWLGKPEYGRNRPVPMIFVAFAVLAAFFGLGAWKSAPDMRALLVPWQSPPWIALTLVLAAFCSLGAFLLIAIWQPKVTATEAGLIYCFEPVFAAVLVLFLPAWISRQAGIDYPNESASFNLLVGGGLITVANVLVQLRPPPRPPAALAP